ncbi:hypothetical protein EDB92DRAFT_1850809 [Lactarius akahatsu]|uniref:Uncharacterized protein n=1 Tax=Lactarius akahatsu TaxID=416441 RepID=A0AAD4LKP5_9AGAM|nr:hypothetical protein EDB92DRAFT_1850809 [Lactarius akahatsu]
MTTVLVLLTFDETESYALNNRIFALLLGGAVPKSARGTVDSSYYTHHSSPWRQTGVSARSAAATRTSTSCLFLIPQS